MPIVGLTDGSRPEQLPVIGQLRKGAEKTDPKRPGKDLDHFRFTSTDPEVERLFEEAFGPAPQVLTVAFPYATLDACFPTWKMAFVKSGLQFRCDGETVHQWRGKSGALQNEPRRCFALDGHACGCVATGTLQLFLPQLGRYGVVTLSTTSFYDIVQISETLRSLERRGYALNRIPFILRRYPKEVSVPRENGARSRQTKWLIQVEPHPDWTKGEIERQISERPGPRLLAAAPGDAPGTTGPADEPALLAETIDPEEYEIVEDDAPVGAGSAPAPARPPVRPQDARSPRPARRAGSDSEVPSTGQPAAEEDAEGTLTSDEVDHVESLARKSGFTTAGVYHLLYPPGALAEAIPASRYDELRRIAADAARAEEYNLEGFKRAVTARFDKLAQDPDLATRQPALDKARCDFEEMAARDLREEPARQEARRHLDRVHTETLERFRPKERFDGPLSEHPAREICN